MAQVTTTDDLVRRFRSDTDDALRGPADEPDADSLWSIADVADYMAEGVDRVARKVLPEFKTFDLPVVGGEPDVRLPAGFTVLDIRRARLKVARRSLDEVNVEGTGQALDDYYSTRINGDWEDLTGSPRMFTRNYRAGYLRLVPAPMANDTLTLTASYSPALVEGGPMPFEAPEDLYLVLLWMKKRAYEKHDADTYDPERAEKFEAEFERRCKQRESEARRIRRAPQSVRYSW